MDDQFYENIFRKIFGCIDIVYIAMDEKNQTLPIEIDDFSKRVAVSVYKMAVASCTLIHAFLRIPFHIVCRSKKIKPSHLI